VLAVVLSALLAAPVYATAPDAWITISGFDRRTFVV